MKHLLLLILFSMGCAYGVAPPDKHHQSWEQAPVPNPNLSYQVPQQPTTQYGDACVVNGDSHICTPASGAIDGVVWYDVTGAPCTIQLCVLNTACYVPQADGSLLTGICAETSP